MSARGPRVVRAALLVAAVSAGLVALSYATTISAYLTHRRGPPSETVAYPAPPRTPTFHLAAVGDVGDSGSRVEATGAAMTALDEVDPYDALLFLGDNVYPNGDPGELDGTVFDPFAGVLDGRAELLAILGNHDVLDGNGPGQLEALGMEGPYWERTYGSVLIVGLDSNRIDDPDQLDFLRTTLAETSAVWKIVAMHHPPYSAGLHGSSRPVREMVVPTLERYGVQLVLSGHDHDYQRSKPIDGVTYIVSGGGSDTRRTGSADFTEVSWSWHHFVDIMVFDDRLELRAVNQDDRVADTLVLHAP